MKSTISKNPIDQKQLKQRERMLPRVPDDPKSEKIRASYDSAD